MRQRFDALLTIAKDLMTAQWRPGEDDETGGRLLNAYLVACALTQILGDYLEGALSDRGLAIALKPRLRRREQEFLELVTALATRLLDGDRAPDRKEIQALARLADARWPKRIRNTRLCIPRGLHDSDLHPTDCDTMAERASQSIGDLQVPVRVVGIGVTGWYLCPLFTAALARRGHTDATALRLRTDPPVAGRVAGALRDVSQREGWVILVGEWSDDPVNLAKAASSLSRLGFPENRVYTVGPQSLPQNEAHVYRMLSEAAVEQWLNRLPVLERLNADSAAVMLSDWVQGNQSSGHMQRLFEVELRTGSKRSREVILGRGAGPGFFGYHAWLTAACLADWVPDPLGIHQGVLFMRWEPGQDLSVTVESDDLEAIATYVASRVRRLALSSRPETTPRSRLRERTIDRFRPLGRQRQASDAVEPRMLDLMDQLQPSWPTVADGRMGPSNWVRLDHPSLLKREFVARDPDIIDPVHDIAAAAIEFRLDTDEERLLVGTYERLTRDSKDLAARMAVHKIAIGRSAMDELGAASLDLKTRSDRTTYARELVVRETLLTRAVNGYLAGLYLTPVSAKASGHIWVLDFDDVIETDRLGFRATSPAGLQALHLLRAHGGMVFACTGLSLGELRERCSMFKLPGGVAEHGGVIWDEERRESLPMIGEGARQSIMVLRETLLDETDVLIDPRYQFSLRLFRKAADGHCAVKSEEVRTIMADRGITGLEVFEHHRWTMVRDAGCGTSDAFHHLRSRVGVPGPAGPVRVVGAATADLDLMRKADACYAPASANADFRAGAADLPVRYASRPHQAGTLQIVKRVLHRPWGRCKACRLNRMPRPEASDAALVMALGLQDRRPYPGTHL